MKSDFCKILIVFTAFFSVINVNANALDIRLQTELTKHLKVLSSNEYSGRKPGTQGHNKAQQYIEQSFTLNKLTN